MAALHAVGATLPSAQSSPAACIDDESFGALLHDEFVSGAEEKLVATYAFLRVNITFWNICVAPFEAWPSIDGTSQ